MIEVKVPPPRWGVFDKWLRRFGDACMEWGIEVWHTLGEEPVWHPLGGKSRAYARKADLPVVTDRNNPNKVYTWQDILPRVEATRKCEGLREMIAQLPD